MDLGGAAVCGRDGSRQPDVVKGSRMGPLHHVGRALDLWERPVVGGPDRSRQLGDRGAEDVQTPADTV